MPVTSFTLIGTLIVPANGIPSPVVGGTAMIVFAIIGTMGIDMLRQVDLREHENMFILAGALAMGLVPIVVPGFYSQFSSNAQILLGNGLAMGVFTAIVLNILFHHLGKRKRAAGTPPPAAPVPEIKPAGTPLSQ